MQTRTPRNRERLKRTPLYGALFVALMANAIAQTAPAAAPAAKEDEETIVLSPFEVSAEKNEGYLATSSLAGTRLKTDLKDVSSAISVITPQFIQDTGATNVNKLLVYTTNTEVGGIGGNFVGNAGTAIFEPHKSTRVRGLDTADLTRDYFLTDIPLDSYNLNGVDIQRGPNSILFGLGSPAGIINSSLKTANMSKNKFAVEASTGSYGKYRATVDADVTLKKQVLGVRALGLVEKQKFRQHGTFDKTTRGYLSARWTPKLADTVYTQFQVSGERGDGNSNRPQVQPPTDKISSWYRAQSLGIFPNFWYDGAVPKDAEIYMASFQAGPSSNWWDNQGVLYSDPKSSVIGAGPFAAVRQRGERPILGSGGKNYWGAMISPAGSSEGRTNDKHWLNDRTRLDANSKAAIARYETLTGKTWNAGQWSYGDVQLTDRSIFDYVNNNLQGPNNTQWNEFTTLNASFVQTYLNGDAGIEIVWDKQSYSRGDRKLVNGNTLSMDLNRTFRDETASTTLYATQPAPVGGTPNPNFGRAVVGGGGQGGYTATDEREGARATAYYKLSFKKLLDTDNLATQFLGEHVFTGLASRQHHEHLDYSYGLAKLPRQYYTDTNENSAGIDTIHYLNSAVNLATASSLKNAHIQGITGVHGPATTLNNVLVLNKNTMTWETKSYNLLTWDKNPEQMYGSANQNKDDVSSRAFIWQSKWFNGNVVGLFGLRKDDYTSLTKGAGPQLDTPWGKVVKPFDPSWAWRTLNADGKPSYTELTAAQTARSYGLMVHTPEFIKKHLPWGTEFSIGYNEAGNFRPGEIGITPYGKQNPNPLGNSKDWSLQVQTWDGKVSFRVTKFKTVMQNAPVSGAPDNWSLTTAMVRAMNGLMVDLWGSNKGLNAAGTAVDGRTNGVPESLVNEWFFGSTYDKTIANTPLTAGQWDGASAAEKAALVAQPLRKRADANNTEYHKTTTVDAQGKYMVWADASGNQVFAPKTTVEEVKYKWAWFDARSTAEWVRPFGMDLWNTMKMKPKDYSWWGGWWEYPNDGSLGIKGTGDVISKGYEYEITVNPTKNWRLTANASKTEASNVNPLGNFKSYMDAFTPVGTYGWDGQGDRASYWEKDGFADIQEWGADNTQSFGSKWVPGVLEKYWGKVEGSGAGVSELRKWRWNLISSYDFTSGPLKGFGVGGAVRWQDKVGIGYYQTWSTKGNSWVSDLSKPIYGPSETNYDAWINYRRKLNKKIDWSVQLNLRDLFAKATVIPTKANPDGTYSEYRIPSLFTWELSTKFEF